MKNYIKKIIVGIFSFALLFVAQNAFAAPWNGVSGDCPDINIANYTTNNGYGSPCWNGTSITASPGDIINVKVYYHNTGTTTNTNTRIKVFAPTGSSMNHSFSAQILSNQGNLYTGNVSVSIPSSQTLTLLSAKWYPNQTQVESSLLIGQASSAVTSSSGLYIGDIAPGWNTQGSINVAFKISSTVVPQLCEDTSASNYHGPLPCTYPAQLCKDTSASNYNQPLPCTYPVLLCKDTTATNYNQPLPCTYPVLLCKDTTATNYNQPLPCTYPQLCKDPYASNYNGTLPCTYPPQLCKDPSASNYNGVVPCQYPVRICQDPSASNYHGTLPCTYPSLICLDSTASNYRGSLPCIYPQRLCLDPSASNYRGAIPCQYPVRICQDPNATNYRGTLPCDYTIRICQDSGATNYRGPLPCRYQYVQPQICTDTNATNYRGPLPCYYQQVPQLCLDTSATNYRRALPCNYYQTERYCQDASATNYRGPLPCNYTVYVNKNVVTTVATNITKNEAQLNGYITNSTYYNANTYFEYGTTVNLGSRTTSKNTVGNSNMSDYLTGLTPNTIYFFRAVGEGPDGTSRGSIEVFKTLADTVVKPIIIQGTTIIGTESPVLLNIANRYQIIDQGDTIDYIVTYKNIGKVRLIRPLVQVILPTNVTLINSSRGTYAVDTHTLSAQIEDLMAGEEGVIYLQARVDSIPLNNSQIPTTAILIYTNANGSQENVMAYVINIPKAISILTTTDGSVLGGAAFFGGLLSIGLIGWLIIILIILLIILMARSYSNNRRTTQETITHTTTH